MKMFIILALVSSTAHSMNYWEPHEKELAALEWKAEHTPEMKLHRQYSNIEQNRVDRAYYEANSECGEQINRFGGITKYTSRLDAVELSDCRLH